MTIDEAIDILERRQDNTPQIGYEWIREANQLAIAALKREKERRISIYWAGAALLPGETEEVK